MPVLRVAEATIAYFDTGLGTPVVLVHGSASSRRQWRALTPLLAGRYRVIAPDLHGYGESGHWTGPEPMRAEDEAEIIAALARRIGKPFHLVGHSYGGCISLVAAGMLADQLLSLTLIEPSAFGLLAEDLGEGDTYDALAILADRHAALARAGELRECADAYMSYLIGSARWAAVPPLPRLAMTALMPRVAEEWPVVLSAPLRVADVAALKVPTLLLYGTATNRASRRLAQLLAAVLPQAKLAWVENADHRLPVTHASAVHRLLAAHLDRHSGAPQGDETLAAPSVCRHNADTHSSYPSVTRSNDQIVIRSAALASAAVLVVRLVVGAMR